MGISSNWNQNRIRTEPNRLCIWQYEGSPWTGNDSGSGISGGLHLEPLELQMVIEMGIGNWSLPHQYESQSKRYECVCVEFVEHDVGATARERICNTDLKSSHFTPTWEFHNSVSVTQYFRSFALALLCVFYLIFFVSLVCCSYILFWFEFFFALWLFFFFNFLMGAFFTWYTTRTLNKRYMY